MPASSSCVTGSTNSSSSPPSSSRRLAVRPVTSRKTESASAASMLRSRPDEQRHDAPQQRGLLLEHGAHRRVRDLHHLRRLERPGLGGAAQAVEQAHLAEQLAALHQREHRLAAVVGAAGEGDAAVLHHVEVLGVGALGEQHVAPAEVALHDGGHHEVEGIVVELGEQLGAPDQLSVHHRRRA